MADDIKDAGVGHNSGVEHQEEVVWERWTKKRVFVRALEGTYGELVRELFTQPRVYSTKDHKWKGGPGFYGKKVINPQAVKVAQSIETHVEVFAPGGYGQKHGHMNSAVFFVLKGKGHDLDDECITLVMKAKPLFLFMHMLFQKVSEWPTKEATPKQAAYRPPADL